MQIGSLAVLAVGLTIAQGLGAAEIKVLSIPFKAPLEEIRSGFERARGHRLLVSYAPSAELRRQIAAGQAFDVVISFPGQVDDLVKEGRIAAGTRVDVARAGLGVVVKRGAAKPDLASADAFRRALLGAGSIAYAAAGPSGVHLLDVIERLGIAAETKPKLKPAGAGSLVVPAVAKGEAEIGVVSIPFILAEPGAELAGSLPVELQSYVVYSVGLSPTAEDASAARAFIAFLSSTEAAAVLKTHGLEPAAP